MELDECMVFWCDEDESIDGFCQECYNDNRDHLCPLCDKMCFADITSKKVPIGEQYGTKDYYWGNPDYVYNVEWICSDCDWFYVVGMLTDAPVWAVDPR